MDFDAIEEHNRKEKHKLISLCFLVLLVRGFRRLGGD